MVSKGLFCLADSPKPNDNKKEPNIFIIMIHDDPLSAELPHFFNHFVCVIIYETVFRPL